MSAPAKKNGQSESSPVRIVKLEPGEVPPAQGLWVLEFSHRDGRLDGWLGRVDWWTSGYLSKKLAALCPDGKADLLVGLDWMLPEGLLLLPAAGEGDTAAKAWAAHAFKRIEQMKPRSVALGVNALGALTEASLKLADEIVRLARSDGPSVELWLGGLPSPRTDGYGPMIG